MLITGTFIDDGLGDIASNNWGIKEWERDFFVMKEVGISTVIPLRCGLCDWANYPSEALVKYAGARLPENDWIGMMLSLAEKYEMEFLMPIYCGWYTDKQKELSINFNVIDELWAKYGKSKNFKGWYNSFELNSRFKSSADMVASVGRHCKEVSGNLPVLLSPYIPYTLFNPAKEKTLKNISCEKSQLQQHYADWDEMLGELEGSTDIIAFQDGHVAYHEFADFLAINSKVIKKHNMKIWTNVELFSRDMPHFRFPPLDWRIVDYKLSEAEKKGQVEKAITFEFAHFMSPFSLWASARNLFCRYCEHNGIDAEKIIDEASAMK